MILYNIVFTDNTVFQGGDYINTKWLEIPEKQIRSIFYNLPLGDCIGVSGYDKYYHFIELCQDINGVNAGKKQLEYDYLICKKDNRYKIYKINLKSGQVEIKILDKEDDFIKNLNPIGWK
jgi:hypothetical protein